MFCVCRIVFEEQCEGGTKGGIFRVVVTDVATRSTRP